MRGLHKIQTRFVTGSICGLSQFADDHHERTHWPSTIVDGLGFMPRPENESGGWREATRYAVRSSAIGICVRGDHDILQRTLALQMLAAGATVGRSRAFH